MFSKLAALTVTSLTLASLFVVPATAYAQPGVMVVVPVEHHHRHFMVEYRLPGHRHWRAYAAYHSGAFAHDVARGLRFQGYETRVVRRA
jgi:hypothetical protein